MRPVLLTLAIIFLFCGGPRRLAGQEVTVDGGAGYRASEIAREILARKQYLLLTRDTVLPRDFRAAGDVVIADADVRLEGQIDGAVAVIGGSFFIRPGARVGGPIASVGGGVYPSGLAEIGEVFEIPGEATVSTGQDGAPFAARVVRPPPVYLAFPGLFGFRAPLYDRVNGLTVAWGPLLRITGRDRSPTVAPWVAYHSALGSLGGGADAVAELGGRVVGRVRVARVTVTNDEWIRTDLPNTLAALTLASDIRNYHRADLLSLTLARPGAGSPPEGQLALAPRITLLASRDRPLDARDPWALFGGDWRRNPPVALGTVVSAAVGADVLWSGQSTAFAGEALVERAIPELGDFGFTHWSADGRWEMDALWNHRIAVYGHAIGSFGTDPAPPQRWSFVGGANTLPTLAAAELRGDKVVFVQSTYGIPLGFVKLPTAGSPTLELVHAIGSAWVTGADAPPWEQNLAVGLRVSLAFAHLYVDPSGETDPVFSAGLSLPAF